MAKKKKTSSKPAHKPDETSLDILNLCRDLSASMDSIRRDVQSLHEKIDRTEAVNCRQRLEILELEESNEELRKLLYTRPFWRRVFG